ncbi:hypothetical protein ACFQZ4_38410 [Catellatospora coxensis]
MSLNPPSTPNPTGTTISAPIAMETTCRTARRARAAGFSVMVTVALPWW